MNPGSGRPITVAPSPLRGERKAEPMSGEEFIGLRSIARVCDSVLEERCVYETSDVGILQFEPIIKIKTKYYFHGLGSQSMRVPYAVNAM